MQSRRWCLSRLFPCEPALQSGVRLGIVTMFVVVSGSSSLVKAAVTAQDLTPNAIHSAVNTVDNSPATSVTATPTFSPAGAKYTTAQSVSISDATSGVSIYYTTNGTTPTVSSTKYSKAIKVSNTETLKAIAVATGHLQSAMASATYTIDTPAATPVFLPPSGTYTVAQTVSLSDTTSGATIYYTTNGATPTSASTKYTTPIRVMTTETVKSIAVASGHGDSIVGTAAYTIESPAATPTFAPAGGSYSGSQKVTISDSTSGTTIYYTTNGNAPTSASTKYTGVITVADTETLKAIAVKTGDLQSAVASATYTIAAPVISEAVLHAFPSGATDGDYPNGLLLASDGNLYGTTSGGGADSAPLSAGNGTVFKITPAGKYSILYSFKYGVDGSTDGMNPLAALIQGKDGNLYGTTHDGGLSNRGTVFKLTLSGTETVIYNFCSQECGVGYGSIDGSGPLAALVQAKDGNFYGTASGEGINGGGVVFKLTPAGAYTVLHSFGSTYDPTGSVPRGTLIQGTDGYLYGTTSMGGAFFSGTVFKISVDGRETVLHSFAFDGADGNQPTAGVIQGSDGLLYGTTSYGGKYNNGGTVYKVTASGGYTQLYSFGYQTGDGASPLGSLVLATDGNLYGSLMRTGDPIIWGSIFRITTAGVETNIFRFNYTDGAQPETALIVGTDGTFYGTTYNGTNSTLLGHGSVFSLKNVLSPNAISEDAYAGATVGERDDLDPNPMSEVSNPPGRR